MLKSLSAITEPSGRMVRLLPKLATKFCFENSKPSRPKALVTPRLKVPAPDKAPPISSPFGNTKVSNARVKFLLAWKTPSLVSVTPRGAVPAFTNKSPPEKSVPVEVLVSVPTVQLDAVVLAANELVSVPELISEEKLASSAMLLESVPLLVRAVPPVPLTEAMDQVSAEAICPPASLFKVSIRQTTGETAVVSF